MSFFTREDIRKMQANNPDYIDDEVYEETANKICKIKEKDMVNFIEIGKNLLVFKEAYQKQGESYLRRFLNDPRVKIGRTQANKYMAVAQFYANKEDNCQLTDSFKKLGIEKICLIMQVKNVEYHKDLEIFIYKRKLSVSQLKEIIYDFNTIENLKFSEAKNRYYLREQMRRKYTPWNDKLFPPQKKTESHYKTMYEHLYAEKEVLEEENEKLKKEIELLKKGGTLEKQEEVNQGRAIKKLNLELDNAKECLNIAVNRRTLFASAELSEERKQNCQKKVDELENEIKRRKINNKRVELRKKQNRKTVWNEL